MADVCCGIGGDSIALARRGALTAIERDELTAAMARINLATAGADRFVVECRDASEVTMPSGTQFHVDPDRREQDRRYSAPDHYSPSWNEVIEMVSDSSAIIKLAPRANLDSMPLPSCHHRCWISLQRTVREQSLLCGELVADHRLQSASRSSVAIAADGTARTFVPEIDSGPPDVATHPQSVLVDPDPAIRAAGLTESFARCYDLSLVGGPSGFLTANHLDQVAASAAEMAIVAPVLWSGPCDMKKIRKELRARNAKVTTAKVRGTDHDPAKILKPLKNTGEKPMTLWIGRGGDGVYAAISG